MISTTTKLKIAAIALPTAALLAVAAPALALETSVKAGVSTGTASAKASAKLTTTETKAVEKANAQIDARVEKLSTFSSRIEGMKLVSAEAKASLAATVQKTVTDLDDLKTKIASETEPSEIRAAMQEITASNRVYALVMPKLHILVAVERANLIAEMMTAFNSKVQARIDAAKASGKDTTAVLAAQADLVAKLADVKLQTTAAVGYVSNLEPDNGDKTVLAANNTALAKARADLRVAESDLKAARKDIATIITALKAFGDVEAAASATTR